MPSPLRAGAAAVLNRPRVLGAVALALTAETHLRVGLGLFHPIIVVLLPPIVAVPVLGAAFPSARAAVAGETAATSASRTLRDRWRPLLALAVVGHVAALGLGTASFLLVDTPVRYALYASGHGESAPATLVSLIPLVGVAAGTLLAWALATPAVVRVLDGDASADSDSTERVPGAVRAALRAALGAAIADPRRTALAVALQSVAVAATGGVVFTGFAYSNGARSFAVFLVAGVGVGLLTAILAFGFVFPAHAALTNAAAKSKRRESLPPVGRVALCALLVSGLVAGAVAVRATETHPIDAAPESLPEDPTAMYATALDNTARSSYAYEIEFGVENDTRSDSAETVTYATAVDRRNRRFRARLGGGATAYADAGAASPPLRGTDHFELGTRRTDGETVAAVPGYWYLVDGGGPIESDLGLPEASAGDWTVVDRGDRTRTLELTDCDEVVAALRGFDAAEVTCERSRVRTTVDTERGVVTGGEITLVATLDGHEVDRYDRYDIETDVEIERHPRLGPRRPGEWLWSVFAY